LAKNQFFIGYGTIIENAIGGSGNDKLSGNDTANRLTGGNGNDTLLGKAGNDKLIGGEGKDMLIGGLGKDCYVLTEKKAAQDTIQIVRGDSDITYYDKALGFKLTGHTGARAGVDKLDLPTKHIAPDVTKVNGHNTGVIGSHHIAKGLITFDDQDKYALPLTITPANFENVLDYLQANIKTNNDTVVFNAMGNSYVFQEGSIDTLIELTGIAATGLSTTGLVTGAVWIA
jgi:Ca2+-binding RTX toxin-like protein